MNVAATQVKANQRRARGPTRTLTTMLAGLALLMAITGQALAVAPTAAAMTQDEAFYVSVLVDEGIGPQPGYTWNDLIFTGHAIAYDLRNGVHPADEAYAIWLANPYLTKDGAITVVAAAAVAFAPELVPIYTGDLPRADMAV